MNCVTQSDARNLLLSLPRSVAFALRRTLLLLGVVATFALPIQVQAVEISFFASVPLDTHVCTGWSFCPLPANLTGSINGTFEIANPLSDTMIGTSDITNLTVSSPIPFAPGGTIELFAANYIAPTAVGEVGQLSILGYNLRNGLDNRGTLFSDFDSGEWDYVDTNPLNNLLLRFLPGTPSATTNYVYAIPEPATFSLALAGLCLLSIRRR